MRILRAIALLTALIALVALFPRSARAWQSGATQTTAPQAAPAQTAAPAPAPQPPPAQQPQSDGGALSPGATTSAPPAQLPEPQPGQSSTPSDGTPSSIPQTAEQQPGQSPAPASSSSPKTAGAHPIQIYGFAAGGLGFSPVGVGTVGRIHLGGGAETPVWRMIGIQPEVGWISLPTKGCCIGSFGLASANLTYHFSGLQQGRLIPFINAGYALAFNFGNGSNLFDAGGGVNYWAHDKWAWRFEIRTYLYPSTAAGSPRFAELRAGIVF